MLSLIRHVRRTVEAQIGAELPVGAFATLTLRVVHLALEFLALVLLARLLSADEFGVYAVSMTCAMLLGVPAAAGFDRFLVREVAASQAAGRWGTLRGVLRRSTQVALASSVLLGLGLVAVASWSLEEGTLRSALWLTAVYLPLVAFARMRQAAMQGLGHVPQGMVTETLVQPTVMLLLAGLVFTSGGLPRTGAHAMVLQVLSATVAMLAGIWLLRRRCPPEVRTAPAEFETGRWIRSAAPMMWMLGMNMLLTSADTLMLGWMLDETLAGQYRVASQVAMLVMFPMTAINLAVAPLLARHFASGDLASFGDTAARAARWSLFAALPIAATLLLAGPFVLGMFGSEFVGAYQALAVLVVGYLVNSFAGAAGYVLIMTRHERTAAWVFTVAAVVNVLANYLLIPRFGTLGAAIAAAGSVAMVGLGCWAFARRLFPRRAGEVG